MRSEGGAVGELYFEWLGIGYGSWEVARVGLSVGGVGAAAVEDYRALRMSFSDASGASGAVYEICAAIAC